MQRIIAQRGLSGLANDTKWNELISAMRSQMNWRPAFRFKSVEGYTSNWDREWSYHLPFPFISAEWLDLYCLEKDVIHRLPPQISVIDHSSWIEPLLQRIGLDFQKGVATIRIFGYYPYDLELFDQDLPDLPPSRTARSLA